MGNQDHPSLEALPLGARPMLISYVELLKKWNPVINLVSHRSMPDVWHRHIADSVQLWGLMESSGPVVVDLGSGGGLPAIPLAIISKTEAANISFKLVESDQRKGTFLNQVVRLLELDVQVLQDRVENLMPQGASCVTARALAPLDQLIGMAKPHLSERGKCIFLKGASVEGEILQARKSWKFDLASHPSITDPAAQILEITGIQRLS